MTSRHGTRARYMAGCACTACRTAHTRYCKQYQLRTHNRQHKLTHDATPYRAVLQRYRDAGWSNSRIGAACKISESAVLDILAGQPTILRATAERINGFDITARDPRPHVPSIGAVRRLRALVAAGHSIDSITQASGLGRSTVRMLLHRARPTIYVATADGAQRAYEALADLPGDSPRSRRAAAKYGWQPPTSWTNDDLDAPEPEPCEGLDPAVVDRLLAGQPVAITGRADRMAAARILCEGHGLIPAVVAPLIGVTDRTVFRWREADWQAAA